MSVNPPPDEKRREKESKKSKRLTSLSARWNTGPISCPYCSTFPSGRTNCRRTGSSAPSVPCRCDGSNSSPCSRAAAAPRCSSFPRRCSRHFRACSPCSANPNPGTRPRPWHWPCTISRVSAASPACSPPAIGHGSPCDDCSPIRRPARASALSNSPDLRSPEARSPLPRLQQWRNPALRAASSTFKASGYRGRSLVGQEGERESFLFAHFGILLGFLFDLAEEDCETVDRFGVWIAGFFRDIFFFFFGWGWSSWLRELGSTLVKEQELGFESVLFCIACGLLKE